MSDFSIDVAFNTRGFENLFGKKSGGSTQSPDSGIKPEGGGGIAGAIGKGMKLGLAATGVIGLLLNLKIIVDLLGAMLGILNLLVIVFAKKIYEFYQDPFRGLLNFGLFLVNGFIGAIESLGQLFPGAEDFEIGRFRSDIVGQELDAGADATEALRKGFLMEEAYQTEKVRRANMSAEKLDTGFTFMDAVFDTMSVTSDIMTGNVNRGFTGLGELWDNIVKKAESLNSKITGKSSSSGVAFAQSRSETTLTAGQSYDASVLQSGTTGDKEARAYNYLTGLGR